MPTEIHDKTGTDHLTRQGSTRCPGDQRNTFLAGEVEDLLQVIGISGKSDTGRQLPVHGGIRSKKHPVKVIHAQVLTQAILEIGPVGHGSKIAMR